jgi:nitrile hydratase subunit beta
VNGVHDLGGMHGFGPIDLGPYGRATIHADWERRVVGLQELTTGPYFNIDAFRYGIERMDPAHYLRASYFERWLETMVTNLIESGFLTAEELDARIERLRQPDAALFDPPAGIDRPAASVLPSHPAQAAPTPRFALGESVITRNVHPTGHTRLPRYTRGKRGRISLVHGPEIFPDTNAHELGEQRQVVYNVFFDGRELWGDSAEPGTRVSIDLWESYLEPLDR